MKIHCTNTDCQQRSQCYKGEAYKDGDVIMHYRRNPFEPCKHFVCVAHRFVYVMGSIDRECQHCGHSERDYQLVSCNWDGCGNARND